MKVYMEDKNDRKPIMLGQLWDYKERRLPHKKVMN